MSFSFNFLTSIKDVDTAELEPHTDTSTHTENRAAHDGITRSSFHWLSDADVKTGLDTLSDRYEELLKITETITLSDGQEEITSSSSLGIIRRVYENLVSAESVSKYQSTDLVSGVYEGGLKIWECSLDLCKHLYDHNVDVSGHILELGCGHGLPSCWILKRAAEKGEEMHCFVVFSDFNEFVLRDVTLRNVVLNVPHARLKDIHVAFGAGDWMKMSDIHLGHHESNSHRPFAVPNDGLFDVILAAETTYSEISAKETAELITRHLRPYTGVAYVATKRYYFGVRGGTECFVNALYGQSQQSFVINMLQVNDNGIGNIREILLIRWKMPA